MEPLRKITEQEVRDAYFKSHARPITDGDLSAFFELCKMFDVPPVGTYDEIRANVLKAIGMLREQIRSPFYGF